MEEAFRGRFDQRGAITSLLARRRREMESRRISGGAYDEVPGAAEHGAGAVGVREARICP